MWKKRIAEARKKRAALIDESRKLLEKTEAEKRELTEEESMKWDDLQTQIDQLAERIAKLEKQAEAEESITEEGEEEPATTTEEEENSGKRSGKPAIADHRNAVRGPEARKSFENLGEFFHAVRFNPNDQRLAYREASERRDMSMGVGSSGGFAVPRQFVSELMKFGPEEALVRPRATVIPAGDPPDSGVDIPALEQGMSSNVYGGVEVKWIGEGKAKPATDAALRQISLVPQEVAGLMTVTDKLLRNWGAASTLIESLLRGAILGAEDYAFLFGDGAGKPIGVLSGGNAAAIKVPRKVLNKIAYEDILKLDESFKGTGGTGVYIYSRKALTEIKQIVDGGGRHIWQPSAAEGAPPTLNGRPAFQRDELPALGTTGDLCLVDLSAYLIKDGSGIYVASSEHMKFDENKTVIKAFWNVDGQPWLNGPFKTVAGDTVSPFTVLKKEIT